MFFRQPNTDASPSGKTIDIDVSPVSNAKNPEAGFGEVGSGEAAGMESQLVPGTSAAVLEPDFLNEADNLGVNRDAFEYSAEDLELLQSGHAKPSRMGGPDRMGVAAGTERVSVNTQGPHAEFVAKPQAASDKMSATEKAAALLADQVEEGTVVDKVLGAESFVLKDPKQRQSNADAHWMTEEEKWQHGLAWPIVIWMGVLHVGAVIAIPFFTWQALIATLFLHWIGGSVGVCLGFHRLLTHGGFKTYPWVKALLAFAGQTAGEGSADLWVATHRKHHAHSDKPGDPHSPHEGSWWSHMLWIYPFKTETERNELLSHWAPDMAKDPVVSWVSKYFLATHFVMGFILLGIGYLVGGWSMAVSFVMWGVFVRTVGVLHVTWFVNSASHMFGYRNYETTDDSRNNWWVAILAYGEGWHNNHHAYPRMAVHGHKWWEFDATWQLLRLMRATGLAWDVVDYRTSKEKRERDAK